LENIVFEQLIRKNPDVFYWKSQKGIEIDFLVTHANNKKEAIQVTYSLTQDNLGRETMGLTSVDEQFDDVNKLILTYDEEKTVEHSTGMLKVMPVWKWLLLD
jgi:predicted AAA+ superfamily ATPase